MIIMMCLYITCRYCQKPQQPDNIGRNDQLRSSLRRRKSILWHPRLTQPQSRRSIELRPLSSFGFTLLALMSIADARILSKEHCTFERIKPIVYTKTNHFVETEIVEREIMYTYTSPCNELIELSNKFNAKKNNDTTMFQALQGECDGLSSNSLGASAFRFQ